MDDPDLLENVDATPKVVVPDDIIAKLRPYDDLVWMGHLLPREMKLLLDAGCRAAPRSSNMLRRIPDLAEHEIQHAWWFYFIPPPSLGLKAPWLY